MIPSISTIGSNLYNNNIVSRGLWPDLLWLKVNEGSGTTLLDSSGNNSSGSFTGSVSWSGSNVVGGYCVGFSGSSNPGWVTTGVLPQLASRSNYTIMGWMNRTSTGNFVFFGQHWDNTPLLGLNINWFNNNTLYSSLANGTNNNTFAQIANTNTGWHHFAATFDGAQSSNSTRLKQYFDGVLQGSTYNLTIPSSTAPLSASLANSNYFTLGHEWIGSDRWSTGFITDIRIYSQTLSSTQILAIYNSGAV